MSFYVGGTSNTYSSSSSSVSYDKVNELLNDEITAIDDEAEAIRIVMQNNNLLIENNLMGPNKVPRRGGSNSGHCVINRDRQGAVKNLFNDYFAANLLYSDAMFRRRFRMSQNLFLLINRAIEAHVGFFVQKKDGLGRFGLSSIQKMTPAIRILAYGISTDATDEYIKIGESTANLSMKRFCRAIVEVLGRQYLRAPNADDVARLLHVGEQCGFPGMLGSLDCIHWKWKNCPTAWAGQYAGRSRCPSIILEAVADYDLWIWYTHFGMPGSNNDINVLGTSNLFTNLANDVAPPANYIIQGKEYNMGYYLADGIYPKWCTLVQTIQESETNKHKLFPAKQESCRKDVERAFGVLQSRWAIIAGPGHYWDKSVSHDIMTACIIMHNMIIEDERIEEAPIMEHREAPRPKVEIIIDEDTRFQEFLARYRTIKNRNNHYELRDALIEHLWAEHANSAN